MLVLPRTHEVHLENTSPPDVVAVGSCHPRRAVAAAVARRRRRLQPRLPHRPPPPRRAVPLARAHRAAPHQPGRVRTGHRRDDQHRRAGARRQTPHGVAEAGVLFPTVAFAVFFLIAFTVSWLLRPTYRVWLWVMTGAQPGVLRLQRRPVRVAAGGVDRRQLGVRRGHRPRARHPRANAPPRRSTSSAAAVVVNLGVLGCFKYYGFFVDSVADAVHSLGLGAQPAGAGDRAAGRHLLLHLPRHQLRHRHRPRPAPAAAPRRAGALHVVLPAPGGGADRAGQRAGPAAADAIRPAAHPRPARRSGSSPSACSRRWWCRATWPPSSSTRCSARPPRTVRSSSSSASTRTRSRSTPTSPATPTSPSAARCCSASASRRTSTRRTGRCRCRTSGGAGT